MANWNNITSSGNVEDRRSMGPAVVGGVSIVGVVVYLLFNFLAGGNLADAVNHLDTVPVTQQQSTNDQFAGADDYEVFARKVLGSNNDTWKSIFTELHQSYTPPKLVLFRSATKSGCGTATSAVGPHYCPADQTIYLDETFFDEMQKYLGTQGGDVAQAYVISHEVGHHIQNQLGILNQVLNAKESNALSIKLELQADCFAGLWMNSIKNQNVIAPSEISEAMDAAASVGDDNIQEKTTGQVNPETWTHGSSQERLDWFNRGYNSGTLSSCDTFK